MSAQTPAFRFRPNIKGVVLFYLVLLLPLVLLLGKIRPAYRLHFIPDGNEFYSHVSNFVISCLLLSVVSFVWILQGAPFRVLVYAGLVLAAINISVEYFVTVLNTPDPADAWYGLAGIFFSLAVMWLVRRKGTRPY